MCRKVFQGGTVVKNLPANVRDAGDWTKSLAWEDPLKEEIATHSSMLSTEKDAQREHWELSFIRGKMRTQPGKQHLRELWGTVPKM